MSIRSHIACVSKSHRKRKIRVPPRLGPISVFGTIATHCAHLQNVFSCSVRERNVSSWCHLPINQPSVSPWCFLERLSLWSLHSDRRLLGAACSFSPEISSCPVHISLLSQLLYASFKITFVQLLPRSHVGQRHIFPHVQTVA